MSLEQQHKQGFKSTVEAANSAVGAVLSIISGQSTPIPTPVKSKGLTGKAIEEVWRKVFQSPANTSVTSFG